MKIAKKENKVVFLVCTAPEDANPEKAVSYNVNGFTFYPRKVFETVGFHTLYSWRGGEDFEFLARLIDANLVYINHNGSISHPRAGYTVFHKMAEKKKFYPYIEGVTKALLLRGNSPFHYFKFVLRYLFYSFFADIFSDQELLKTLEKTPYFQLYYPAGVNEEKFEIM
ncbi:MAG: hypothetical protein QXT45_00980 [Candidatus Bilamarchaeaceae archaeon]